MKGALGSAGIEAARVFDEAGRYAEAMEALKQASLQGDHVAMTELAHRLLIGDRAPKSPKHALYFLEEAAKAGEARALARIAALTAAGAYVQQDWQQALRLLGQAATAGDASARGQIVCLQPAAGGSEMVQRAWHA